jgi:hypothetical protein
MINGKDIKSKVDPLVWEPNGIGSKLKMQTDGNLVIYVVT